MPRFRIQARCHVGGEDVVVVANMRLWRGAAWQIVNDGRLSATVAGQPRDDAWVEQHWDALADALFNAADAFVRTRDSLPCERE